MKKFLSNWFILIALLIACAPPPTPTPTPTARPTSTPAPTSTPTVTPTPTPPTFTGEQLAQMSLEEKLAAAPEREGYTAWMPVGQFVIYENAADGSRTIAYDFSKGEWKEIKQYPIAAPEDYLQAEIPDEDLLNGEYLLWLYTLSRPFDPSKVADVPFKIYFGQIVYDPDVPHDFSNPETTPFRRDVTSGHTVYEKDGKKYDYVVLPIEFYDKNNPDKNQWVITVLKRYDAPGGIKVIFTEEHHRYYIKVWREKMRITPIMMGNSNLITGFPDPLVSTTFAEYPDMEERFQRFVAGDVSALSGPGMVLLTDIWTKENKHYK